jgi:hypothetical protein
MRCEAFMVFCLRGRWRRFSSVAGGVGKDAASDVVNRVPTATRHDRC